MHEYIEIIVGLIAILTFVCGVVNYTIIKPQSFVVNELKRVVEHLDSVVTDIRNRVVAGEVKIDDLQVRVDALEKYHKEPVRGKKS